MGPDGDPEASAGYTDIIFNTCVDTRWGWLVFPTVLVLLTLVFFASVVTQTRTRDAMASGSQNYKNPALLLLFHGLEETTAARYGGPA